MNLKAILVSTSVAAVFAMGGAALAAPKPSLYPTPGAYNPVVYTFTAAATGDVTAYFTSSTSARAVFDDKIGLEDNGVLTAAGYGLDNHTSMNGDSFNFGSVTKGDTLTFILENVTTGQFISSNPAQNGAYDNDGDLQHNHIYSTTVKADGAVPAGTYVGFEDGHIPFNRPGVFTDFDYADEEFVFTNTTVSAAPEPGVWALMLVGVGLLGATLRRQRRGSASAVAA